MKKYANEHASVVFISGLVHYYTLGEASACSPEHKAWWRACHYRYFSRPSIIVARQGWGMLRWAWLKPRMPPDLLWRKRGGWGGVWGLAGACPPHSIDLPTVLFICYLVHQLLLRVPSPLPEFYSRCCWIVHVSLYVPQYLALTALLCVDDCAWRDYHQPSIHKIYLFQILRRKLTVECLMFFFSTKSF